MSPEIDLIIYLCGSKTNTEGFPLSLGGNGGGGAAIGAAILSASQNLETIKCLIFIPRPTAGKNGERGREGGAPDGRKTEGWDRECREEGKEGGKGKAAA